MARLLVFPSLGRDRASHACETGASYEPHPHAPVTETEPHLLEARFPTEDRVEQARGLQSALRRLAAAQGALELGLGEGLETLHSRFDIRELAHSNLDALGMGRLGFSAAHGRELRRLATRLPELPWLRQAFIAGLLPRTRVRELLDVASAEDDAAWAQLARRLTTRELEKRVRAVKAARRAAQDGRPAEEGACAEGADEDLVRASWLTSGADRATWGFGIALLRQLSGVRGPVWKLAELLAAETLSSCGPAEIDRELAEGCVRSESRAQVPPPRRGSRSSPCARRRGSSHVRYAGPARRSRRSSRRHRTSSPARTPGSCSTGSSRSRSSWRRSRANARGSFHGCRALPSTGSWAMAPSTPGSSGSSGSAPATLGGSWTWRRGSGCCRPSNRPGSRGESRPTRPGNSPRSPNPPRRRSDSTTPAR